MKNLEIKHPNRLFAAILLKWGLEPRQMWKGKGFYGCGKSGVYFYPDSLKIERIKRDRRLFADYYEMLTTKITYKILLENNAITVKEIDRSVTA